MFLTIKKWTAIYVLSLVGLFSCFALILWKGGAINASKAQELTQGPVLIIDAGHGGIDGGAIAKDGTTEAEINLPIALKAEAIANFCGLETVMTRREDISIHSEEANSVRQKKISDLRNRAALVHQVPGGLLLSIHQNILAGVPSVHGAQVFFNGAEGTGEWAEILQTSINAVLNDSPKSPRKAGSDIYLLDHVDRPAALVECGFLSNPQELKKLTDPSYQTQIATTLIASTLQYLCPANSHTAS